MIKFLDKNMPFLAQTITVTLAGMTFLLGFSRMTANYEISLLYVALGFIFLMWVMYKFFERGVGAKEGRPIKIPFELGQLDAESAWTLGRI